MFLLIEGRYETRRLFDYIFKFKGCSYIIAPTGKEGLEELKNTTPKLILLDIMLPDISGFKICKQIKNENNLKCIPVFYVTGIDIEEVKSQFEETGADEDHRTTSRYCSITNQNQISI
jgi:DNA-binding response OmpR family regulator